MKQLILMVPNSVPDSENSMEFHQMMVDRMSVSCFKYGKVADAFPERVDAVKTLLFKLATYIGYEELLAAVAAIGVETNGKADKPMRNVEALVDVANYAMIEFMRPRLKGAHYLPTDSGRHTARVWLDEETGQVQEISQRANDLSIDTTNPRKK